jgi:hypothetical protein
MNEVFTHAAFGQFGLRPSSRSSSPGFHIHAFFITVVGDKQPPKPSTPYSIFDKAELENRVVCCCVSLMWVGKC